MKMNGPGQPPTDIKEYESMVVNAVNELIRDGSFYINTIAVCQYCGWSFSKPEGIKISKILRRRCGAVRFNARVYKLPDPDGAHVGACA